MKGSPVAEFVAVLDSPHAADLAKEPKPEPVSFTVRLVSLAFVILPFLGLLGAVILSWGWGFTWVELALLASMYVLTTLGITVGYHRLFSHRSFETHRVVQVILSVLGSMAFQGNLFRWVAVHRRHHQYSDHAGDPHSPYLHGRSILALVRGFWHAHMGWMFAPDPPHLLRYVTDLRQDRLLRVMSALFPVSVAVGLLIPAVLGGILTGSWMGALLGLMWGGLARIFLIHHVTWSINSVCHLWGRRPFQVADESRNNLVFGILAMGEGWHNNHHAFQNSARHGLRWWEIDVSYWVIRGLALMGLAWRIKLPAPHLLTA
jgi:stearoyl-CoA desaturase (Delta-9 desaturase)